MYISGYITAGLETLGDRFHTQWGIGHTSDSEKNVVCLWYSYASNNTPIAPPVCRLCSSDPQSASEGKRQNVQKLVFSALCAVCEVFRVIAFIIAVFSVITSLPNYGIARVKPPFTPQLRVMVSLSGRWILKVVFIELGSPLVGQKRTANTTVPTSTCKRTKHANANWSQHAKQACGQ